MALKREALVFMSEFIAFLLFGCTIQCCYGQEIPTERVKLPLCNSYDTTSFEEANMFNQTSQDEALFHMHTFSPLIATFCHEDLMFFTCTVHFPRYIMVQAPDSPPVLQLQPACRSLCNDIYRECKYAMDKINFHWPDQINCDKFRNDSCVSSDPKNKQQPDVPKDCTLTQYDGGTPICSSVISAPSDEKYFGTVDRPFTNYFSHTTQERAIYELSTHARLIQLLITQQPNTNSTNDVTQCLHDVTFLLCNLYLPRCGLKRLQDYPISATQCKNTLEKNCSSAISQIRARGYNITWPPVSVNCDNFPEKPNLSAFPEFKQQRTFRGLSPPPPAVDYGNVGEDFLEIKWNSFPEEYKFGATVETGILYRKSGSRVQYQHVHTGKNIFRSSGLNSSTTYEVLVGTVNSKALLPGTLEKIQIKTVRGVEQIKAGFCSSLYNYTKLPNLFGHKTQDKAINSMHTFSPLLNTHCSSDLKALLCSAYLPRYLAKQQTTQPPCQTLCAKVLHRCTYAIRKLNFKWPEELECSKLNKLGPCYPPSPNRRPIASETCELVQENSICSFITEPNGTLPHFNTVEKKFRNYFNHTSQQQAVYELSQHAKLLSLLSGLIVVNPETRNQCVQRLAYFLCSLYLPNCSAAIEMSRNDCQIVVDNDTGVCTSFLTSLRRLGYSIRWPPVQVDCNSISASVATPNVGYGEITFDNMFPPPAVQSYQTLNKSVALTWIDNPNPLEVAESYEILFKVVDKMVSYTQKNFKVPKKSVVVPIDTSKNYEILVAYVDDKQRMPGYFEKISYTAGTSVHDLPSDLSLCRRYYDRIVLPNRFGDNNMTTAKIRMFPFFPLIYTLCSEDLTAYLCSAIFPRYYFGMQQPCKITCERILQSCSYAISRTKFLWPSEFKCDSYPTDQCFDVTKVTIPTNRNPPEPISRKKRAALPQCKATTTAMCLAVLKTSPSREGRQVSQFKSTFSEEPLNYFKHKSTDEAIFELSKHLRLLSTLQEYTQRYEWDSSCLKDLTVLLCHLYLPACPLDRQPRRLCTNIMSDISPCARVLFSLNEHNLQWPPVQVNCQDEKWFTPNGTIDTVDILPSVLYHPPPPKNIVISGKALDALSMKYKLLDSSREDQRGVGVLYRPNNSQKSYSLFRTARTRPVPQTLNIQMLTPGTEYEIKIATLDRINQFPGIFRTITSRTFDVNVFDMPTAIDICYKYYKQTWLPNMYGDQNIASAKLRFLPFYPLVHTFCSSELEAFLCSIFLPRYDPERYISQEPCQDACERVYQSCQYAIGRFSFLWPEELQCSTFSNAATCYNLTKDKTLDEDLREFDDGIEQPPRRLEQAVSQDCKPTPSTPICATVLNGLPFKGEQSFTTLQFFKRTFQNGNYFNHSSTDEAVYELSKYLNLLSSLERGKSMENCSNPLILLLCHLHLPACPPLPVSQRRCFQAISNTSACFTAIKNLNNEGANFTWPPVHVNCQDTKWFIDEPTFDRYIVQPNRIALPAPRSIHSTPKYSTKIIISFRPIENLNVTALYRRRGTSAAYQFTTTQTFSTFGNLKLDQLIPATDYEIQLASLSPLSGLPGPFVGSSSNTFGQCQNETTGEDIAQGRISWTTQDGSTEQYRKCPYGSLNEMTPLNDLPSKAIRTCQCDVRSVCKNPFWLEPDMTICNNKIVNDSKLTLTLSGIAQKLDKDEISLFNASKELVIITSLHAPEFTEDDVILATFILEDIVSDGQQLNETAPNIVKAINNLLNIDADVLLDSQRISNASARLIRVLDQCLENIPLNPGQTLTQNEANIAVHGQEYDPRNFTGAGAASILENTLNNLEVYNNQFSVQPDISQVSMTMPRSLFENLDNDTMKKDQRISFVIYRKTSFFTTLSKAKLNLEAKTVRKKNSFVISGSVKGQKLTNLTDPIVTTYQPLNSGIEETTACVFWNFTGKSGLGDWSRVGCTYIGITDGVVTCHCLHLTNFAILMDFHIDDRNEPHDKALSIISYIGCAISLVGLTLTIITILILKDLRTKVPTQILLNFCIALSLTLIVFLVAAERSKTSSLAGCRAAAIALHYFVLAMFVWTSIQAYNMYLAFVKVMPTYHAKFMLKCCVVGWGLPAVVVIVTAALKIEEYGDENFCRVQGLPFQIGFLAPVVLILIINTIAFILIIRSLLKSGSKVAADKRATGLQQARRASAIMVVLGLTWLFGVLAVRDAKLIFQYLFCIFNSIQGLLVFIFYCVLSSETKAKYRKLLCSKNTESETSGKQRYPHSSSEGKFHEINSNKNTRSNVYTTSTAGGSSMSPNKTNVEMTNL